MTAPPPDWRRVTDLFHLALDRPASERAAFVDGVAGHDRVLASELQSLLAAHDRAGRFLDEPAALPAGHGAGEDDGLPPIEPPDEEAAIEPGTRVGAYLIRREIGRGGMGIVYLADDMRLGRAVALKALPPAATTDPVRRERLRREARAAAALSHPSIATVYALEEIDGNLFIAGEYIPGRTLRTRLAAGPLPVDDALSIAVPVAAALEAAHAAGIVHRDLKPENILLGADGRVRVVDFGIASLSADPAAPGAARLTAAGGVFGTPAYMSPEQVEGREVDFRSDLFSFGAVLHEMVAGSNPFEADTPFSMAARVVAAEPRPLADLAPSVPPALEAIVRRCLAKHAADRYARTADLAADLVRLAADRESRRLEQADRRAASGRDANRVWWVIHQAAVVLFFVILFGLLRWASGWIARPWNGVLTVAFVIPAVVNAILRANLLFTARFQPSGLAAQLRRTRPSILASDLLANALLVAASAALLPAHITTAVLLAAAGIGNAAVAVWVEPATIEAAFPGALTHDR